MHQLLEPRQYRLGQSGRQAVTSKLCNDLPLTLNMEYALGDVPLGNLKMIEDHLAVHVKLIEGCHDGTH